jgi:predicted transcriptional regulator
MAGRPRTWKLEEGVAEHKITMRCPRDLWKELQGIALAQDTSATALVIKAIEQFLESERKEGKAQKKPKKA